MFLYFDFSSPSLIELINSNVPLNLCLTLTLSWLQKIAKGHMENRRKKKGKIDFIFRRPWFVVRCVHPPFRLCYSVSEEDPGIEGYLIEYRHLLYRPTPPSVQNRSVGKKRV